MLKLSSIFFAALLLTGCAAGLGEDYSCTKVGGVPAVPAWTKSVEISISTPPPKNQRPLSKLTAFQRIL